MSLKSQVWRSQEFAQPYVPGQVNIAEDLPIKYYFYTIK